MKNILILLCLFSCNIPNGSFDDGWGRDTDNIKDIRTNLCFAENIIQTEGKITSNIFVNVPCTAEVEKLIVK